MGFDRTGNISIANDSSVTPEAPVSAILAVTPAAPGAIGATTPAAGTFTNLAATGTLTVTGTATLNGDTVVGSNGSDGVTFNAIAAAAGLQIRDTAIKLYSSTDGQLDIDADGEVEIDTVLVDINANADISGTLALGDTVTVATSKKIQFRDTGLFINSSVDGQMDIDADTELEITAPTVDIDASSGVDISAALTVGTLLTLTGGLKLTATARTATADGTGNGTIAAGTSFVVAANGGSADNIIVLPAPTVGSVVLIYTTGALELRSSAPATVAINGGTGASAESALASGSLIIAVCVTTTAWLAFEIESNGTTSGVEAAA